MHRPPGEDVAMNANILLLFAFGLASCGGKPITSTTDSGTGSGSTAEAEGTATEGNTSSGSSTTTGSSAIMCEEAISKEECENASPPERRACAWLQISSVLKQPNTDCTTVSTEGRCYSGFVDVQSGGFGGGCSAQYLQTGPGAFDAYGGWECFRITSGDWATCIDQFADACGCYTPG